MFTSLLWIKKQVLHDLVKECWKLFVEKYGEKEQNIVI